MAGKATGTFFDKDNSTHPEIVILWQLVYDLFLILEVLYEDYIWL